MTISPELLDILRHARHVAVLTGAGISAESGMPTFREAQTGLWARYRPEALATPDAFRRNPRLVWDWYTWRRELATKAQPNAGHLTLAELERRIQRFTLITQNVDGLHQRAGSQHVIELHGNIHRNKCFEEDVVMDVPADSTDIPPRCPRCGGLLRPDVVWFGEMLPEQALRDASHASQSCDVFLSIGTSAQVYPAASLPFDALRSGATVVEINREETRLTDAASYVLHGPAGQVLPALLSAL